MPKNPFTSIARESARKTDAKLIDEITTVTPLTKDRLNELLPTKSDKQHFAELMQIVHKATNENKKLVELKNNIDRLGPIALKALKFFK